MTDSEEIRTYLKALIKELYNADYTKHNLQEDLFEHTIALLEVFIMEETDRHIQRILPELLKRIVREVRCEDNGEK